MPGFFIPMVLGSSLPVTATFLGATLWTNLVEGRMSHAWAIQCAKGESWQPFSMEVNRLIDDLLADASEGDSVARLELEDTEHYIDFATMQLVQPAKNASPDCPPYVPLDTPRKIRRKVIKAT